MPDADHADQRLQREEGVGEAGVVADQQGVRRAARAVVVVPVSGRACRATWMHDACRNRRRRPGSARARLAAARRGTRPACGAAVRTASASTARRSRTTPGWSDAISAATNQTKPTASSARRSCCSGRRHQAKRPVAMNDQPISGVNTDAAGLDLVDVVAVDDDEEAERARDQARQPEADQRGRSDLIQPAPRSPSRDSLSLGTKPRAPLRRSARPSRDQSRLEVSTTAGRRSAVIRSATSKPSRSGSCDVEQDDVGRQAPALRNRRRRRRPPRRRPRSPRPRAACAPGCGTRRGRRRQGRSWPCARLSPQRGRFHIRLAAPPASVSRRR